MIRTENSKMVNGVKSKIFPLLKRASILIEDGDFENAEAYCERVLEIDPENGTAYLGKLMAKKRLKRRKDFANLPEPFDEDNDYQRFVRYGNAKIISELKGYIAAIKDRVEEEQHKAGKKKKRRNLYIILSSIAAVIIIFLGYIVLTRVTEYRQVEAIKARFNVEDVNARYEDGKTPLMRAVLGGDAEAIKVLLKAGADVNAKTKDGETALVMALLKGHTESVNALIKAGADVNANDNDGRTALMWAAYEDNAEAIKVLLKAGANVNAKTKDGETALMVALLEGHTESVNALIKAGADVNAKDIKGGTALMWAALYGQAEDIKLLLNAGADVNARNDIDGKRAVDIARKRQKLKGTDALRLLEERSR